MTTNLTIQKLQDMLGAHKDGVYTFAARGEDFAVDLAVDLLAAMRREAKLVAALRKYMAELPNHTKWFGTDELLKDYPSEYSLKEESNGN